MVHFSTSDDTVCTSPPAGDCESVFYWQAPDFMTDSLFLDLLMEVVDAISNQDTQRFLQLLESSQALWDELQRWNRKRKKWFDDDKTCSLRVRRACSNFYSIGDLIFPSPPEGSVGIISVDVLINNESDPSGELRRRINQTIAADNAFLEEFDDVNETEESQDVCVEDKYSSDEEEEIDEEVEANPEKPCYYPSQIEMATILKKRIDTIMWHYHNISNLSDAFDDVEFAVYTARYRMLSDQTEKRICHPDAGVLSKEELESRKECNGKKRMFMYVRSADTDTHFKQLRQEVQEKPKTLFIIIADECHWGITKDKDQKPSAHNLFINEWCKDKSPRNVVVVQISATPFNLLTQNSRLPEVRCLLLYDKVSTTRNSYEAGDLLPLEREPELEESVKQASKEIEMHVVHWSEVELKNFERGMRMKLKSTLIMAGAQYRYLQVSSQGKLGVTYNQRHATDFLVQGSHGIVTIKAISNEEDVRTITRDTNGGLEAKVDPQQPAKFKVKLDFGVGVAAFFCCDDGNYYLAVDDKDNVTLQAAKIEKKCGVSIMKPKHDVAKVSFEYYIDQCGPPEVDLVERQYMSLNHYLSTMNCCNTSDQKIREDKFFQGIVDKAKRQNKFPKNDSSSLKVDALLCAEYCYYILHVSTYDSNDKIRQALTSSYVDKSPAAQFSGKLASFFSHLKKDTKYIHHEAFELVRREICDKVKDCLKENLKKFSKMQKRNKSKGKDEERKDREVLEASFVACLMHHSLQDLQKFTEETHATSIFEDIKQSLQDNHCQKMIEIWNSIIQEYETSFLVKNLIQSGKGESGKMKIVRAKSMETANQFYHTLRLARALSSLEDCFEIIRDYGGIQIERQLMKSSSPFFMKLQPGNCQFKFDCPCSELKLQHGRKKCVNCRHVHKSITQYEDLENLACVLILVDKGRMGDTFPQSFDCLDLRLNYDSSREFKEGSPLFLSTVIQELGRMCRYAKVSTGESHVQNIPYVLVGRELFKRLEKSVETSPAMSAISCTRADRYMTNSKNKKKTSSSLRWLDYEAHKDSYDHQNKQKHCNRILLQAEPQIGKTGTYLCLIKHLRLDILGKEKVSSTTTTAFDKDFFYLHKECDDFEVSMDDSINDDEDWQFPYWKAIKNSPSLYEKAVGQGKYSIGGCFYTHDTEESPFILMKRKEQKPTKSSHNYQKTDCSNGMRAWHWYHFENCVECGRLLQGERPVLKTIEVNIDGTPVTVTCSLPTSSLLYSRLREQLSSSISTEECWTEVDWSGVSTLPYWIFHPSHRDDPRKCLLNYHHVMQEESKVPANYVQVAVVRNEKFQAYRSTWGKVIAIFQLPDELPNCELGASEGGVGYARLFIQKIAYALKLEYIFVIDDNVAVMSEAVFRPNEQTAFGESVVRDENGVMRMQRCSFTRPLAHLQKIAEGKDIPPDGTIQYEPHPLKEQPEGQQFPLYSYTGPAKLFGNKPYESYGVLGLLRSVPITVKPFAKTQVYAAFLLNVKSTVEKKVYYRPWPCWEDLRFNDDCDKAGLWVVKCNRFLFHKVQYNDWFKNLALPSVFEWKEHSTLEKRPLGSELPKDLEEGIILDHLRNLLNTEGPSKCLKGKIGYDQPDHGEDKLSPTEIVERLEVNESTEDGFTNEIPILIVSYCASNRKSSHMMLLNSSFCAPKEKIIFITSAKDAMERWPGLTLAKISSPEGICFSSEMSDRNGQFSILSAADPTRHNLRWILIETSFLQSDDTMLEECNTTVEENISGKESDIDESISFDCQQHFSQESTRASIQELQEPLSEASFFQELSTAEQPHQGLSNTKERPREIISVKMFPSLRRPLEESPKVNPGSLQDSPSKRRKIDDYFSHQDGRTSDDVNAGRIKTNYENKETGRETSETNGTNTGVEKWSQAGHEHMENFKRVKTKKKHVEDRGEGNSKGSGKRKQPKVRKKKKIEIKNSKASTSSAYSSEGEQIVLKNVENKHTASISRDNEDVIYLLDDVSNASSQTSTTSVYSIQDLEENMEWTNIPETYSTLTRANEEENDDDSNGSNLSSRISVLENRTAGKISPSNPAYMTGTTSVTKVIVDLWREYRRMKRNKEGDLTNEQVQNSLDRFTSDELQVEDKQGYTALLKACSLPSMSPHVIQYLIVKRNVDLNYKLPHFFDKHHLTAKGLIAGMSALSVAIRRKGNAHCVSTFMRRQTEIDVRDADQEGNTALHHCVISVSKSAFQKLFPLYEPLDWQEMRNIERNSPLDIAWNLTWENPANLTVHTKKQSLKYILEKMEECDLSAVFR